MKQPFNFQSELTSLINRFSAENDSNTPDFILAQYMADALEAFNKATNLREKWYGRDSEESKKLSEAPTNLKYIRVTDSENEFLMPAGEYYVGDLCYVFEDDEWSKFLTDASAQAPEGQHWSAITVGAFALGNNYIWYHGTAYGDGCYCDQDGHIYGVDAGILGVFPVSLIAGLEIDADINTLGKIHKFDQDFLVSYEGGTFKFGHLTIPTGDEEDDTL